MTATFDPAPSVTTEDDQRSLVRIFLAASQDLDGERKNFEEIVLRIAQRPNIARSYRLAPVHWQQGGGDAGELSLQALIENSLRFEQIPIVVVLVGGYVGDGTRAEYEAAKSLHSEHGSWPKILPFFKCRRDGVTLIGDEAVQCFHLEVIEGNFLPTNFSNDDVLEQRFGEQVESALVRIPKRDPLRGEELRKSFVVTARGSFLLALAVLAVTQTMSFPESGVSSNKVLLVLAAPPVLFAAGAVTLWLFVRLMKEFRYAWHSAEYADERIYQVFRNLFPRSVIPPPLRNRFPRDPLGEAINWLWLLVVLITPLAAHYNCTVDELLHWSFVMQPDVLAIGSPAPKNSSETDPVRSRFVAQAPLHWPYRFEAPGFKPTESSGPLIYLLLFALQSIAAAVLFWGLMFLGRFAKYDVDRGLRRRSP